MGNSLPLPSCACHYCSCCHDEVNNDNEVEAEAGAAVPGSGSGGAKKRRKQLMPADRSRSVVRAARPRHVVVPVVDDAPEDVDGAKKRREQQDAVWPECRVEPAAGHGEGGGVVRVRIVMKRKDIPHLVARLERRSAEERNAAAAGMEEEEEVSTEIAGCSGNGNGGGSTMTSPCRDGWTPRLSIIPENY